MTATTDTLRGRVTDERLTDLLDIASEVSDDLRLRGPWGWHWDLKSNSPYLATQTGGRRFVFKCRRLGFSGAQPSFPVRDSGSIAIRNGAEIPVFEVCPDATDKDDPRVYRTDVVGFRSPVANYMAAVDADTVVALITELMDLRAAAVIPADDRSVTPKSDSWPGEASTIDDTGHQIRLLADQLETQIGAGGRPANLTDLLTVLSDAIADITAAIETLLGNDEAVDRGIYCSLTGSLAGVSECFDDLVEVLS